MVIPAAVFVLPPVKRTHSEEGSLRSDAPKPFLISMKERLIRFDAIGISFGVPGILLLTYAFTSANTDGWGTAQIIAPLIISIFLLGLFLLHERRASTAILAPHLFRDMSFNLTLILAVNTYAVRQACTYFLTVQLQSYGNSPVDTSVLFIPLGISALISNTITGRIVPIFGARTMFIWGWGLSIPGVLLFSFIDKDTSYWRFTFPAMILYIAGIGAVYITSNFVVVSSASKSNQGAAAGVFNVALQVGGSVLGLAILTAVAEGIEDRYGPPDRHPGVLTKVGFQSVYYSCVILCGIGMALSLFAITVPPAMRGSIWKKDADVPTDNSTLAPPVTDMVESGLEFEERQDLSTRSHNRQV